jgi:hypothetical protein
MIATILELITGKDDLERMACRDNPAALNAYLKTRPIWIPREPKRFLDPTAFTPEELLELIRADATELDNEPFTPWIIEMNGKRRLPAFSSQKRMKPFTAKVSQELNKVFSLGCAKCLLDAIVKTCDVEIIDLNCFSRRSWQLEVRSLRGG